MARLSCPILFLFALSNCSSHPLLEVFCLFGFIDCIPVYLLCVLLPSSSCCSSSCRYSGLFLSFSDVFASLFFRIFFVVCFVCRLVVFVALSSSYLLSSCFCFVFVSWYLSFFSCSSCVPALSCSSFVLLCYVPLHSCLICLFILFCFFVFFFVFFFFIFFLCSSSCVSFCLLVFLIVLIMSHLPVAYSCLLAFLSVCLLTSLFYSSASLCSAAS